MADRRYSLWNLRWNIKLQQLVDMYFPIGWPKYFSSKDVHCGELKSLKYNRDRSLLAVVSDHSVCIWNNRVNMKLNIYVHVIVVFLLTVHFNIPFSLILALVFIIHIQIPSQTTCLIYMPIRSVRVCVIYLLDTYDSWGRSAREMTCLVRILVL